MKLKQPKTQIAAVAYLFLKGRRLTAINTITLTGSTRLSARIFDLRKLGLVFKVTPKKFKTIYNTHGCYDIFELDTKKTSSKVIEAVKNRFNL